MALQGRNPVEDMVEEDQPHSGVQVGAGEGELKATSCVQCEQC